MILFFSCSRSQQGQTKRPFDLIDRDKMVQVLADVHVLEATLSVRQPMQLQRHPMMPGLKDPSVNQAPLQKEDSMPYYNIFRKNGVTRKQYQSSMKWYCAHPEELSGIYDDVITEINKRLSQEQEAAGKQKKLVGK
ncbi:MAG: DUF4296 domain-containing protein [Bacteroidetes bacterium]|nr:DUF4296 domain-containing protein [Bacteroidota bacterium]